MNNNYNQVLHLITLTHTEKVNQAQAELKLFAEKNSYQLFSLLVAVLKDSSQEYIVKTGAATYLNSAISDDIFVFKPEYYGELLMALLMDRAIQPMYKRLMERAIINILENLNQPLITQFREQIYIMMKDQNLRDTAYLLIGCYCIPESMDIQHVIYLTRVFMPQTLSRIVLTNSQQCLHFVKEYSQILKMWIVAWDRLYAQRPSKQQKEQQSDVWIQIRKLLSEIVQSDVLISIIQAIYSCMAQQPIYLCISPQLYQLNIFKQQAAQLHYRTLNFINKDCKEITLQMKTYQVTNNNIIKKVINSLMVVVNNYGAIDQLQCKDFTIAMIKVVRVFLCCHPPAFKDDWKGLLKEIILPLLKPDDDQMDSFQENPTQFCALFEDCSEKQTFGIIKTQISKLLQKLSDKSEKITQQLFITDFIINFFIDSMKNNWSQVAQNPYGIEYVDLSIAAVGISIFSFRLENHLNKLGEIRTTLNKNIALSMSPYNRAIMYMFLSYNFGQVFPNRNQGSYWVQIALKQQAHPTTKYCANDFIDNISDQFYSDYFVQQISNKILTNNQPNIWTAIQKLIRVNAARMSEGLIMQLLGRIYQRLEIQFTAVQKQEIKQTLQIIKLIQIIRALADQDEYCKQNFNIRNIVWKIILAFDKAVNLGIQSEMIEIILCLVRQEEQISDTSKQVLNLVLQQFTKDQYRNLIFYRIINHYIMKSSSEIIPQVWKTISTAIIFIQMNMSEKIKKSQKRFVHSHLLLLLQNMVAVHATNLTQQEVIQIGAVVMRFVPNQLDSQIECKVVLARALNTLLLTHMISQTDCVWRYIQIYSQKQIFYSYDLTVLLSCIKVLVFKQKDIQTVAQMIVIAARSIEMFRKRQKLDLAAKKQQKKHGKQNRLKPIKYKQFQKILKYMKTPFHLEQSFQKQLASLLQNMKQSNLQVYKKIAQSISQNDTTLICKLCKFTEGSLLNKRVIYVALKPKDPVNVKDEDKDEQLQNKSDDQDLQQLKRKRVNIKKLKKKNTEDVQSKPSNKNQMQ